MYRPRPSHPYANAPRLPESPEVRLDEVMPGAGPFEIEIGPGRGGFLFEKASLFGFRNYRDRFDEIIFVQPLNPHPRRSTRLCTRITNVGSRSSLCARRK